MEKHEKIVIFDWGGVIESHDPNNYNMFDITHDIFKEFGSNFDKTNPDEIQCLRNCQYFNNTNIFEINTLENLEPWFNNVKKNFKLNCNYMEYCEAYKKYFNKSPYYLDIVKFAHYLKDANLCKIGVFSNLCILDKERIDKQMILKKFDYVWLSYELKVSKPKPLIYDLVEKDLSINPSNILFIDDCKANTNEALNHGWNIINTICNNTSEIKNNVFKFIKEK